MIDAIKPWEEGEGFILRLHEYVGTRQKVTMTTSFEVGKWQECDLMEKPIGEIQQTKEIQFEMKPYEIKTFFICIEKEE